MCVDILSTWTRLVKRSIISRDFLLWYYWGNKLTNLFISQCMRALSLLPLWVSGTMHQNRNIQSRSLFCYRQCSIFRVPLVFQNELDLNLNQCYLGKEQPAAPEPPWLTPQGETLPVPRPWGHGSGGWKPEKVQGLVHIGEVLISLQGIHPFPVNWTLTSEKQRASSLVLIYFQRSLQWNIIQLWERRNSCHMWLHGWTCWVK